MKAFLTGGTGFIGASVARKLRARSDDVAALVRTPSKAAELRELGCELVEGDLADLPAIERGVKGADAVYHVAGIYEVGVSKDDRERLFDGNVRGTERVLDAAVAAGVPKIVYVSTVGVFGNTHGEVFDETYRRPEDDPFLSVYEETKYLGHKAAEERIAAGAPVVIVQPGGVYGPGDHSMLGLLIDLTRKGWMKLVPVADTGFNFVHVDDVADGILLAHDKGRVGEAYVVGGELMRMRDLVERVARLAGRAPPWGNLPTGLVRASAPLGPLIGRLTGLPSNIKEMVDAGAGVTYWATDQKARRELGYSPRDTETGLTQTLAAIS